MAQANEKFSILGIDKKEAIGDNFTAGQTSNVADLLFTVAA
jgi:hypothetical protein